MANTKQKHWNYAYGATGGEDHKFWGTDEEAEAWIKKRGYVTTKPSAGEMSGNIEDKMGDIQQQIELYQAQLEAAKSAGVSGDEPIPQSILDEVVEEQEQNDQSFEDILKNASDELKNSPYWQYLTPQQQTMMVMSEYSTQAGNEAYADAFQESLVLAGQAVGPYWQEQMDIITQQLGYALGTMDENFENQHDWLLKQIDKIENDLEYESEYLTLEQQSALARQKEKYGIQVEQMQENMASRGLSGSSIKAKTAQRLKIADEDVIESTTRHYNRLMRNLTTGGQFNIDSINQRIGELQASLTQSQTSAVHTAEGVIGTEAVLGVGGTSGLTLGTPGSPFSGTIGQQELEDTKSTAESLMMTNYPNL